jgi:DNA-binding Lrp family transcriptional regulator
MDSHTPLPSGWTFFTNHAHVLFCIARNPEVRLREVAVRVGITERAVQRIVTDLEAAGYLTVMKEGRRNHYRIHAELPLRHPVEGHRAVKAVLDLVLEPGT